MSDDRLHLQDLYSTDRQGDCSLDDAHEVMLKYLDFLEPDADSKMRAVAQWEAEYGYEHPCRSHW